jgi:hypothetical protein
MWGFFMGERFVPISSPCFIWNILPGRFFNGSAACQKVTLGVPAGKSPFDGVEKTLLQAEKNTCHVQLKHFSSASFMGFK